MQQLTIPFIEALLEINELEDRKNPRELLVVAGSVKEGNNFIREAILLQRKQ